MANETNKSEPNAMEESNEEVKNSPKHVLEGSEDFLKQESIDELEELMKQLEAGPGKNVEEPERSEKEIPRDDQLEEAKKMVVKGSKIAQPMVKIRDDQHVEKKKSFFARIIQGFKNFIKRIKESIFGSSKKGGELNSVPNADAINKVEPENEQSQSVNKLGPESAKKIEGVMKGSKIAHKSLLTQKGKEASRSVNLALNARRKGQGGRSV